jgi:phospholipid-binding lipoprotein MlaA
MRPTAAPPVRLAAGLIALALWSSVAGAQEVVSPPAAASGAEPAVEEEDPGALPAKVPRSRRDPLERFNRSVFKFNELIDNAAIRPVAEGYRRVVPEPARGGVENFFGNLGDVWSAINKLLQGKVVQGAQMTLRVATNTVFGLGGVLDPATEFGLERQSEDFGQTLGTWGLPTGPYLVLPVFGPSTVRDASALPLDRFLASPSRYLGHGSTAAAGVTGLQLVSARAGLLGATRLFDDIALDKYSFLRDAYLARRRSQVYDGDPPDLPEDGEQGAPR